MTDLRTAAALKARERTPAFFKAWLSNYLDEHVSSLKGMSAEDIADEHIDAAREIAEMTAECLVAQPEPAPVAVKALEWRAEDLIAESSFGVYQIAETIDDRFIARRSNYPTFEEVSESWATLEDAKAAAQADFEKRIRSALSDARVPEGWRLVPSGQVMTLAECPVGMFLAGSTLALKTEYGSNEGRIDAYIVDSGEFFWGAAPQTIASQRATLVQPLVPAAPRGSQPSAPLVWVSYNPFLRPHTAVTEIGTYNLRFDWYDTAAPGDTLGPSGDWAWYIEPWVEGGTGRAPTEESAKSACQADYDRRRAALQPKENGDEH
ncbi:hypothetical protein NPA31_011810 [Aurantimonas sp. MSK8Z-1]|uniref:hypothetical protein n=1 Tax=Mangrovibrevibacter kandeliae TaxID=2968473 RepID=UPI002118A767|nr:hypothetical protein [Aurantimonas sp. MSK8Z-1]MCW4115649.1 hypothetical protein [Aurantimonas sp. MSK8Z-1]